MMEKNAASWVTIDDGNGRPRAAAIPHDCHCGEHAIYGAYGRWFCTLCWLGEHRAEWESGHETDRTGSGVHPLRA